MSETASGSRVGTRVGPYQLRRLLGRGGMGEVYEAHDTVKDRVVALKLMTEQVSSDNIFRQRMQREALTAGRLQEPHIVPIHDYGEINGQLFIDMRFVQGTDVGGVLRREGPLPPPRAVAIIRQIASALDAAHRAGVIHRDVKPENILLTDEDFAYLVDFGIAAALPDQHLTKTGTAVGTWNYMAPERFGNDEITYRADIYALACVLYESLTGAKPYPADSLPQLMAAHLTQPVPQPSRQRPGIPLGFDEVIARGMAKDPAYRYPSAGELASAAHQALSAPDRNRAATLLEHSEHNAPPPTVPIRWPPPPEWAHPPPRTNRKPWVILAAAILATTALLTALIVWRTSTRTSDIQAHTTTPTASAALTANDKPATTTTNAAVPMVAPAQLNSILLSPAQVDTTLGTSGMQQMVIKTEMDTSPATLSNPACYGAFYVADARVYANSAYTGVNYTVLQGKSSQLGITQAAVTFPSAEQATDFMTSSASAWRACGGQTVIDNQGDGNSGTWTFGNLTGAIPKIAIVHSLQGAGGWTCEHALSTVSNVVLDVVACGPAVGDQASRVAAAMAANVPK